MDGDGCHGSRYDSFVRGKTLGDAFFAAVAVQHIFDLCGGISISREREREVVYFRFVVAPACLCHFWCHCGDFRKFLQIVGSEPSICGDFRKFPQIVGSEPWPSAVISENLRVLAVCGDFRKFPRSAAISENFRQIVGSEPFAGTLLGICGDLRKFPPDRGF